MKHQLARAPSAGWHHRTVHRLRSERSSSSGVACEAGSFSAAAIPWPPSASALAAVVESAVRDVARAAQRDAAACIRVRWCGGRCRGGHGRR